MQIFYNFRNLIFLDDKRNIDTRSAMRNQRTQYAFKFECKNLQAMCGKAEIFGNFQ